MAIIVCPIIESLNEVPMLTSERFRKAGHVIRLLRIRNSQHKCKKVDNLHDSYCFPAAVSTRKIRRTYNERINTSSEIKIHLYDVEPLNGLEVLNKHLKRKHKGIDFYVLKMETEVMINDEIHICTWSRKQSVSKKKIFSLHLTHIDCKNAIENYTTSEMKKIAGGLSDGQCKLGTEVIEFVRPLC